MEIIQRTATSNFRCQSRWADKKVLGFLKKVVVRIARFLYSSKKTILVIIVAVLITLSFNFLMASWVNNDANDAANDEIDDRIIPTTGTIYVRGLEIYGGDIKSERGKMYIDWGELTLGASKNASFYVRSNCNVDVKLGLNVTNWVPAGIGDYIGISWYYNGTVLSSGPNQAPLFVTINLAVSSDGDFIDFLVEKRVTSFGFDMTIYASGV